MSLREAVSAARDEASFASEAWVGRLIEGRYRVDRLLGEGGMGAVFLATQLKLDKRVALKIILPQFAGDGELAERFAREAMASAKLDHPHIASASDYGALAEGGAYLVMQYVPGRNLRDAMDAGDGGWPFACAVGAQIADALAAAHAHRIVHRDLKPENVILETREDDDAEHVKVLDFGVARVVSEEGAAKVKQLTRVGTIIGTPGYMAPEQALGESVDERADLYALGVVLWEICARQQLYPDDDLTAIVTKQLTEPAPSLASFSIDVPAELTELVARLLAHKRDQRPARAVEVRDVLRRLALGASLGQSLPPDRISQSLPTAMVAPTMLAPSGTGPFPVADRASSDVAEKSSGEFASAHTTAAQPLASQPRLASASASSSARSAGVTSSAVVGRTVSIGGVDVPLTSILVAAGLPFGVFSLALALGLAFGGSSTPATTMPAPTPSVAGAPPPPEAAPPTEVVVVEPPPPELDSDVEHDIALLTQGLDSSLRDAAAARLLARPPAEVPAFAIATAQLETSRGCRDKRAAIRTLRELGDARALPALERADDLPRRGCGFLNTQDCYGCMRRDLSRALRELRP